MKILSALLKIHSVALLGQAFQIGHDRPSAARAGGQLLLPTKMIADHSAARATSLSMTANLEHERRLFIQNIAQSVMFSSVLTSSSSASAEISESDSNIPKITHKVYFDVRISRADGSFYVRDASPTDTPDDEPFYGQFVLGLFGETTPNHVQNFLKYVEVPFAVDNPLPSYGRSKFNTLDAATGLLIGGTIPGLDATTLAGGNVLEYSGKIYPAKLWLEDKNGSNEPATAQLSHNIKGLVTHRNLDPTPAFGITTRSTSTSLDASHTIFGCILEDKTGLMDKVVDLPVLTDEGRVSRTTNEPVSVGGDVGGSLASSAFTLQRRVFRDAAKTFGDTRLDKLYDGKILRRVEVTQVGVL